MSRTYLLFSAVVISSMVIGYLLGNVIPIEEKIPAKSLTVEKEFLSNPILYEWWASAEGIVTEKGENSITIENEGRELTMEVSVEDGRTQIFREEVSAEGATPALATLDEIRVGSRVRSGVAIARKGTAGIASEESVALATTLVILEEE